MTTLTCPLCCTATFDSRSALKTHILEILERFTCPFCHTKFNNLLKFTQHLDNACTEEELDDFMGVKMELAMEANKTQPKNELVEPAVLEFFSEIEENDTDTGLIESGNEGQYFCQMCQMHFNNVEGHLKEFHEGQEFVVEEDGTAEIEEEEEEETDSSLQKTIYLLTGPGDPGGVEEENEEDEDTDDASYKNRTAQTIQQPIHESVTDKDGRVYTRKFVKIDKFWLQNETEVKDPSIQQYIVESGEVKKITQEEADQIDNKDTIIEINQCPDCKLQFPVLDHYKKHKCAAVHDNKFRCTHCNSIFNDSNSLRAHQKVHVKKKPVDSKTVLGPFNCDICNTLFPTFKSLRLHKRMHEPIKERDINQSKFDETAEPVRHMFICKICNKTYAKHYEEIHMQSHDVNNGFNCEVCNRKFFTQANLDMHMKAHSNNKKFACSYCKKPFVTYDALNNHLTNQCQKRPYACQYCGRRFARPHEKVKHERIHTGEKPHVCEICGKAFRVSYCLTLHLRTHSGSRPYQCSHCGKRFKSHSVYNHHMLTHSDVRAYKCPYCPKAFKTSVQLAGHKNSHIKPFTCTECNRPFASLYAVRAHMETHKRDNNLRYDCWMCGALYSRAFALRDHLKQQHHHVGEKVSTDVLNVEEEIDAANSLLVKDDIILGLDAQNSIEIIEGEGEEL